MRFILPYDYGIKVKDSGAYILDKKTGKKRKLKHKRIKLKELENGNV